MDNVVDNVSGEILSNPARFEFNRVACILRRVRHGNSPFNESRSEVSSQFDRALHAVQTGRTTVPSRLYRNPVDSYVMNGGMDFEFDKI